MSTADLPLSADDMRLLAEIGFIGAQTGQLSPARALFDALAVLRPDSTLPAIGLAIADLTGDKPEAAVKVLREKGLAQHPDDVELKAFLGLALQAAGKNTEAHKVLSEVVAHEADGTAPYVQMAASLLAKNKAGASPASLMPRWSEQDRQAAN